MDCDKQMTNDAPYTQTLMDGMALVDAMTEPAPDTRTEREILLSIEQDIAAVRALAQRAMLELEPLINSVSKHPLLSMLLGGGK